MPILDARHDGMHAVETDTAWSESYYFNAYDPGCEAGLYTRVGIRPHEGTMDVMLAVWLPDGGVAFARAVRDQTEMTESPLEVGGLANLQDSARWRAFTRGQGRPWWTA